MQLYTLTSRQLSTFRRFRDYGARPSLRSWFRVVGLCLAILLMASFLISGRPRKLAMDGVTALRYRWYPLLRAGRQQRGPECSMSVEPGTRAIVTYMLTEDYMPLLEHLHCSVTKSNPDLEFVVMVTRHVSPALLLQMKQRGIVTTVVDELQYPNTFEPRFRFNWLKIRAWQLPYDAILLVDSDVVILEDVSPLFSLPTRFAATEDQVNLIQEWKFPRGVRIVQGGVLFIRPCTAVARHMEALLGENALLQFPTGNAEQEFFSWYFRHEGIILPRRYDVLPLSLDGLIGPPAIVHYTSNKPFSTFWRPSGPESHLCTEGEVIAGRQPERVHG